jgi:hypothetical protein
LTLKRRAERSIFLLIDASKTERIAKALVSLPFAQVHTAGFDDGRI